MQTSPAYYKDEVLNSLATRSNVAQFVSFSPRLEQRYCRVSRFPENFRFPKAVDAISALLETAPEHRVNIRSYTPHEPQGNQFIAGLDNATDVLDRLLTLGKENLFTIVNETVDINDGGVSGVLQGGIAEFAPWETPRCVESRDVASLPKELALSMLAKVYRFEPALNYGSDIRVEFSVHPFERGYRHEKTIIWEEQLVDSDYLPVHVRWPNDFSRLLGDKTFGLLLANCIGLPVPYTQVLSRHIPPFEFGETTHSSKKWVRPCPTEKDPGRFETVRGWTDPFALMAREDPDPTTPLIRSVLVQDEVPASYAGAVMTTADGSPVIDGVKGFGDDLMLGRAAPIHVPLEVEKSVLTLYHTIYERFGPLRLEWVFDGEQTWVVQLQQDKSYSRGDIIFPGAPEYFVDFDVRQGVGALRELITRIEGRNIGVRVIGHVGMTSHIAERLTKARIPSIRQPRQLSLPWEM